MPPDTTTGRSKRKAYILDPKWQLSVSGGLLTAALLAATFHALANQGLSEETTRSLTSAQLANLALAFNVGYFLILAAVLIVMAVRVTHSVVGPAMVLERSVRALAEGRYDSRLTLRKGDYLRSLAGALEELTARTRGRSEAGERLCRELEAALEAGDAAAARAVAGELSAMFPQSPEPVTEEARAA